MTLDPQKIKHATPDALANDVAGDQTFTRHPMVRHIGREIARAVAEVKYNAKLMAQGLPHGPTTRYIICEAPPRHGKSTLISEWTPVWYLRHFPHCNVGVCSYESTFASSWGRKIRDNIERHADALGGLRVRADQRSVSDFGLTQGGRVFTTGIGGPLTGRGFHLLLIDDPVKNAQEAASAITSEAHWEWWQSVASTRLEPGSVVVVMMTRWNEMDLIGRLLEAQKEDPEAPQWMRLKYPALAEEDDLLHRAPGQALWPERFPAKKLRQIRKQVGEYFWAAMFEQRPAPLAGGMFEKLWFPTFPDPLDHRAVRVRSWDLAATAQGDFTAGVLLAKDLTTGHVRIEDVERQKLQPGQVKELVLRTAMRDGPSTMVLLQQDPGQSGKDQIATYKRIISPHARLHTVNPTGDKVIRAVPLSMLAQGGGTSLVQADWNEAFIKEAVNFKEGCAYDDQIDAASLGLALLETKSRVFRAPTRKREERETTKILKSIAPLSRGGFRKVFSRW